MKKVVLIIAGLTIASTLYATAPMKEGPYPREAIPSPLMPDTMNPLKLRFNYLYEFAQIAQFCAEWQLDEADSADHGGMIEAETGPLRPVIQTDNTLEAIWVWARYGELTGDVERFRDNIDKAWIYCENFPAWEEEGEPGNDYYRNHNCAWGVAAEQRYRAVYADDAYRWYADSCAEFMKFHPMNIWNMVNRFVTGWCAGWLYSYGVEREDDEARDSACSFADSLLSFIEPQIEARLGEERWAMSAGTMVWGICNSAFLRDTLRGQDWISQNGHYLDTFQTWYANDYFSWDNSWNVGFANGHGAMYDISHDPTYARHHKWLTHKLLSYDTDNDGGIMATTQDADTTDMTWVSLYLCMMGLDRLIGEVYDYDAGALEIVGIYDGIEIEPGSRIDLVAVVSNYGREPLSNVKVILSGDASGSAESDLAFLGMDTITLVSDWLVPDSAVLTLALSHPQDEHPANDTLIVRLNKAAGIKEWPKKPLTLHLEVASLTKSICRISYAFPNENQGELALYDVLGARVRRETLLTIEGSLEWDISELSAGIYFIRLDAGKESATSRFVFLR
jgi:hypothetical protein